MRLARGRQQTAGRPNSMATLVCSQRKVLLTGEPQDISRLKHRLPALKFTKFRELSYVWAGGIDFGSPPEDAALGVDVKGG